MSRELLLVVKCDVCGAEAPEIAFRMQVDGVKHVLDLCEDDRDELRAVIQRYLPEPAPAEAKVRKQPGRGRRRGTTTRVKVLCPEPSCGMTLGRNNLPRHLGSAHGMDPASVEATLAEVTWPE